MNDTYQQYTMSAVRATSLGWTLGNLMRSVFPLDSGSKLGGYPATILKNWNVGANTHYPPPPDGRWPWENPAIYPNTQAQQMGFDPSSWWRFAIVFMFPEPRERQTKYPLILEQDEMCRIFGGYQLFRHIITKMKILCIDPAPGTNFSPIASLVVQDNYWNNNDRHVFRTDVGARPFSAAQSVAGQSSQWSCNETTYPTRPPPSWNANQRGQPWEEPGAQAAQFEKYMNAVYAGFKLPSFGVLTSLGAPWTFPPQQKLIGRGSFTHHTFKGTNDPQGERWLTLMQVNQTSDPVTQTDLDRTIATIFLAQGTNSTSPIRFGTAQYLIDRPTAFQNNFWAIIKFKSKWQLGNKQRPYIYDVNQWISTMNSGNPGADLIW